MNVLVGSFCSELEMKNLSASIQKTWITGVTASSWMGGSPRSSNQAESIKHRTLVQRAEAERVGTSLVG